MPRTALRSSTTRTIALLGAVVILLAIAFVPAPHTAGAAVPGDHRASSAWETSAARRTCVVRNLTTRTTYRPDAGRVLARAINAARAGDRLRVRGRCAGNYTIDKALMLVGPRTRRVPMAVLNGRLRGPVLTLRDHSESPGRVELRNLRITNGRGRYIGGIVVDGYTRLILSGRTAVVGNHGSGVGGSEALWLRMANRSSVSRNSRSGIMSVNGEIVMTGRARVSRNGSQKSFGGGVELYDGELTMKSRSVISGNVAEIGGGVVNDSETSYLTMLGASRIVRNKADHGGGIFTECQLIVELADDAAITGNRAWVRGGGIWGLRTDEIYGSAGASGVFGNAPDNTFRPQDDEQCYDPHF